MNIESAKIPIGKIAKEQDFVCGNCNDILVDPRMLICMHTICMECAKKDANINAEKKEISIECKLCKEKRPRTTVPTMEKEKIRDYLMKDVMIKEKALFALSKNIPIDDAFKRKLSNLLDFIEPEICSEHNLAFIKICLSEKCKEKKMCKKCIPSHYEWHFVDQGEEHVESHFHNLNPKDNINCPKHKNCKFDLYCLKDNEIMCRQEKDEKHLNHPWETVANLREYYINEIAGLKENFKKKEEFAEKIKKDMEESMQRIKERSEKKKKLLMENMENNKKKIELSTQSLREKIEEEKKESEENCKKLFEPALNYINKLENATIVIKEIDEKMLIKCHPNDLFQYSKHLKEVNKNAIENIEEISCNPKSQLMQEFEEEILLEGKNVLQPVFAKKKLKQEVIEKGQQYSKMFYEIVEIVDPLSMSKKCPKHNIDYKRYCEIEKVFLCSDCLLNEPIHLKEHEKELISMDLIKKKKIEEYKELLNDAKEIEAKLKASEKKLCLEAEREQGTKIAI